MGVSVYQSEEEAKSHLHEAFAELSHGGKPFVMVEHHALGWVIAEFKTNVDGTWAFQRWYDAHRGT